jgi:hypothetical protein
MTLLIAGYISRLNVKVEERDEREENRNRLGYKFIASLDIKTKQSLWERQVDHMMS